MKKETTFPGIEAATEKPETIYQAYVYQRATIISTSSYLGECTSQARTYSKAHPCALIFVDQKQPELRHILAFIDGHDATLPDTTEDALFYAGIKTSSPEPKPKPTQKYLFYQDPSHGWIKTTRQELIDLHIDRIISKHSYQSDNGNFVYLEEDGDANLFLNKKAKQATANIQLVEKRTDRPSIIRTYKPYTPTLPTLTIYDIKERTKETSPHFFSHDTLKFFGQTMKDFNVTKRANQYRITAPIRDKSQLIGHTLRYFDPSTNELSLPVIREIEGRSLTDEQR